MPNVRAVGEVNTYDKLVEARIVASEANNAVRRLQEELVRELVEQGAFHLLKLNEAGLRRTFRKY